MVLVGWLNRPMKKIFIYGLMSVVSFVVNFLIYNYSFNMQATPYLHESQRVDSGMLMLKTTLPAYLLASVSITLLFYFVAKFKFKSD